MWTQEQCERLALEEKLVKKYFPNFTAYDWYGDTRYTGFIMEPGYRNSYLLRLELPSSFPDEEPYMYVESPKILRMYKNRGIINSLDSTHAWHNYGNGEDNCVNICFTDDWDSSCTCVMAIQRGWICG